MWLSEVTYLPLQPHTVDSKAEDGPRPGGAFDHTTKKIII